MANPIDEKELEHRLTKLEAGQQSLQKEVEAGFKGVQDAMGEGFEALRGEMGAGFQSSREQRDARIKATEDTLGERIGALGDEVERVRNNEQKHSTWALGLVTGTLLMAVLTLALRALGWI